MKNLINILIKNIKQNGYKETLKKIYLKSSNYLAYNFDLLIHGKENNQLLNDISNHKICDIEKNNINNLQPCTIAIHLHIYYVEMLPTIVEKLNNINIKFTLFISISNTINIDVNKLKIKLLSELNFTKDIIIVITENRGRDIAPMITTFGKRLLEYDIICHLHTKKSKHMSDGDQWFRDILYQLMGSKNIVYDNIKLLQSGVKVVFPEENKKINSKNGGWDNNYIIGKKILLRFFNQKIYYFSKVVFPQGTMFWAKSEAIKSFLSLPLEYSDFPKEPLGYDGSIAHALERIILISSINEKGNFVRLIK